MKSWTTAVFVPLILVKPYTRFSLLFALLCPSMIEANDQGKIALHLAAETSRNMCESAPTDVPCSQFDTSGPTFTPSNVYVVVGHGNADVGIRGVRYGIDYWGSRGEGIYPEYVGWDNCTDGLEFPYSGPNGGWPAPGSGILNTWSTCQRSGAPGFDEEGTHAIVGAFYLYAYSAVTLAVTSDQTRTPHELYIQDCEWVRTDLPDSVLGAVRFSPVGDEPGVNPCENLPNPPLPPPPPPPPPPEPSPPDIKILLHIDSGTESSSGCQTGPVSADQVVTSAESNPDGTALYYVYVLGTPDYHYSPGLRGLQFGIEYDEFMEPAQGLRVFDWITCSDLQFDDDWPASGSGNTFTWVECQESDFVVAGYFYLSAYSPSVMSIVSFPPTGKIKASSCLGDEISLEDIADEQVGWVSLGGGSLGSKVGGCNPLLEPCGDAKVPVIRTTWGQIKTKYAEGN